MKPFLTLVFFLGFLMFGEGQTISELTEQLEKAESKEERMRILYELGNASRGKDPDKSLEYARQSHELARSLNDRGMTASSAYIIALAYERKRDDRNMEVWFRSATEFAKKAGDVDLIVRSVNKRARLAEAERKQQRTIEIYRDAFEYFSQSGTSISELQQKYALEKKQIQRERDALEMERSQLKKDIIDLTYDLDELASERTKLKSRQEDLIEERQDLIVEKQEAEKEVYQKVEALDALSRQKNEVELQAREYKETADQHLRNYEELSKEAMIQELELQEAKLEAQNSRFLIMLSSLAAAFFVVLALMINARYRQSRRAKRNLEAKNQIIEEERQRSDDLLLNILPAPIAEELKEKGKASARKYEEVTVLFADFKNFTQISQQLSPEELVQELDECFREFDAIIGKYKEIEKIKTIGDAYMCAAGLSERKVIPRNIVNAALEMQQFLGKHKLEKIGKNEPYFEARIGLHTGPVVAGVVGTNKFAYDIWGDTVNTASRIESKCEEGRVNISETTYQLVKYQFDCEPRGKVEVKNKGPIEMYFVNRALTAVPEPVA